MNARTRRKLEMGMRALDFSRAHPDGSPGYSAALARLENRLARADQLAAQQRDGILQVRAASARKYELRRILTKTHLEHLARVAEIAAQEAPELPRKFLLRPENNTYLAFRTAARGMAAEAEVYKELLVKHGLADAVLENLVPTLDEFDAAVQQGTEGRRAHVGASAELDAVADEVVQVVKVMDALNRLRFASDPEALAAWESASNVVAAPRANGEVEPTPEGVEEPSMADGEEGEARSAA